MNKPLQFIDIVEPGTGRTSSLAINGRRSNRALLTVTGGLDHQAAIEPRSIQDADLWIEWLKEWKSVKSKSRNR